MKLCNTAAFATLFLAGTTSASLRGAIDATKNKLHPGRQRQSNLDIACDADVQECSDGSFVSRDPNNGCEFPSCPNEDIVCTEDVQECSDGSFVSRDPTNDCKFPSCPNEDIFCAADIQECDDGSFVSRDPTNNCEFPACPSEDIVCAADVQECGDGSFVSRDPANNCEFPSCGTLSAKPPPPPVDTTFRFNVRPQEFSPSVMDGYTDCEDLKSHIIVALKAAADKKISDGMGTSCTWYDDYPNDPDDYASAPDMVGAESKPSTGGNGFNNRDNGDGVNSFDTNNQVDGVDEADLVKANGKHVFLSYSNQIIVTDTNGQILLRQDIPQPKKPENKDVYQDQRTIQGMLLSEDNILTVMTQFYNHTDDYSPLGNAVTTTFVYQFDEKDNLLVLKEEFDTSGSYSTARMINGTSYLITNSNMDTYNFTGELYRCDEKFRGLSDEEYEAEAFNIASSTVESFASKIMDALDFTGTNSESCENIVQIFDQNPTETDSLPDMWFLYNNGVLNTFSQITSFQTSEVEDNNSEIKRSYAGIFLPTSSWDTQAYASENLLVLSGGGYRLANVTDEENRDCQITYEYTFLVTFDLDGQQNVATLGAAGDVEGSIVNGNLGQFSMDYFDDHLRVATSFSARYGFCPLEDGDRLWKRLDPARSQVSVLQGQDGILKQVGVTDDLGGDGTIASVRFLGDKGYVSSWQNKDPLYVLDLSDPSSPTKTAELNVTDSLNYLHPLSNGKKLLAVGSASSSMDDADNYVRGLKISLFNVEDSSNPYEEESYVFETIGYSKALSDHHAFRYIPQNGLLSIPGYEESWKDKKYFDGAWLFHIDPDNGVISKFDNVRHAGVEEMTGWYCWNPSQLPSRSMMFNSNLLTMLSHSIALTSNDGDTTTTNIVNLDEGRTETKNDDCSQYRGYRYGW